MSLSADLACSDRGDLRGGEGAMGIAADASPGPRPPSTVLNATCAVILLRAQRSSTYRRSAQLLRHIYRKSHGLGMRQGFSLRASYRADIPGTPLPRACAPNSLTSVASASGSSTCAKWPAPLSW